MGGGGEQFEGPGLVASRTPPRARHHHHHHRRLQQQGAHHHHPGDREEEEEESAGGGLDLPPPVFSRLHGQWQPRPLNLRTLQHFCTLRHPPPLHFKKFSMTENNNNNKHNNNIISAGTAPCDPLVAFGRYVVTATDDGRVCLYDIIMGNDDERLVVASSSTTSSSSSRRRAREKSKASSSSQQQPRSSNATVVSPSPSRPPPVAVVTCERNARIVTMAAAPVDGVSVLNYMPPENKSNSNNKKKPSSAASAAPSSSARQCPAPLPIPPDDGFVGHLVVLTSDGDVFVVECGRSVRQSHHDDDDDELLEAMVVHSWNTERCNPSCVAFRSNPLDHPQTKRLCIGYKDGCLEEWQVTVVPLVHRGAGVVSEEEKSRTAGNRKQTAVPTARVKTRRQEEEGVESSTSLRKSAEFGKGWSKLLWRGRFETSVRSMVDLGETWNDPPLLQSRSEKNSKQRVKEATTTKHADTSKQIASVDTNNNERTKAAEDDEKCIIEGQEQSNSSNSFLAVCIQVHAPLDERLGAQASSSSVEVVNTAMLERDWKAFAERETSRESNRILDLGDYCVWPGAGMELLDTASVPLQDADGNRLLPRRMRAQPTLSSDKLCTGHHHDHFFAAALSDGTVALVNASASHGGELTWGVASHDKNQVCLSYPAIGLAHVRIAKQSHIACCLRGGTVYVVPMIVSDDDDDDKLLHQQQQPPVDDPGIFVFLPPPPESGGAAEEPTARYIHGFAAGNIIVTPGSRRDDDDDDEDDEIPIVVYAGAGGVLEVYICGLLGDMVHDVDEAAAHESHSLLQDLLDNGAVRMLLDVLESMKDDDPLLQQDPMYRLAREECHYAGSKRPMEEPTLSDLLSDKFVHVRALLRTLARVEDSYYCS